MALPLVKNVFLTNQYFLCVHLVLLLSQLILVEVSSEAGGLQPQPAFIEPGLQLLTVIEELKQFQLSLQLFPPKRERKKNQNSRERKKWRQGKKNVVKGDYILYMSVVS